MFFLGYHGTSEPHATSILRDGVLPEKLNKNGQIGRGFYIAKLNKHLPRWAATFATAEGREARSREWYSKPLFERILLYLTGAHNLPVPSNAKSAVLKVYSDRPLHGLRWSVMQASDIKFIQATGGLSEEMKQINLPEYLQMVIPPDQVHHLICRRDDGLPEGSTAWLPREAPHLGATAAPRPLQRRPTW